MESISLELRFPNLRNTGYRVESPRTRDYNCVAWAAGDSKRPWWPVDIDSYYWPEEPRVESLSAFISAFGSLGYEVSDNSNLEIGFEKVAIYIQDLRISSICVGAIRESPLHSGLDVHTLRKFYT